MALRNRHLPTVGNSVAKPTSKFISFTTSMRSCQQKRVLVSILDSCQQKIPPCSQHIYGGNALLGRAIHPPFTLLGLGWLSIPSPPAREGCHESRRCSRDTYSEPYITKHTSIRRKTAAPPRLHLSANPPPLAPNSVPPKPPKTTLPTNS